MSNCHGDPRDFGPVHVCGDSRCPNGCGCRPMPMGPLVAKNADFVLGNHLLQMPVGPKRTLADDVDALTRRVAAEHPGATMVTYIRDGWRVSFTRAADGSTFSLTMVRA